MRWHGVRDGRRMTTIANKRSPSTTPVVDTSATSKAAPPKIDGGDDHVEDLANAQTKVTAAVVKRAPPETVAAAEKLVDTTLQGSPSTEQADEAAMALIRLPNADYADSIKALAAQPGQLEKLLDRVSPQVRDGLVRRLSVAGVLHAAPAPAPPVVSPRAPTPPPSPPIFKDDPALPKSLRQLAVDENVAKMPAFREQVAAYREQYGAAVDNAKSIAELRALGPMHPPQAPESLPTTTTTPADVKLNAKYQDARGLDVIDTKMTTKVADKIRGLSGHAVAGISVKVEGKAMVTLGNVSKVGLDLSVGRAADGTVSGGATGRGGIGSAEVAVDMVEGKVEGKVGAGGLDVTVNEDGVEVESSSSGPSAYGDKPVEAKEAKGGVTITKTGGSVSAELGGTGGGVAFDKDKGVTFEGKLAGLGGKGTFNGDGMSYAMGIEKEFGTDDFKVELEAEGEVGLQGVTKFDRDAFISTGVGFFERPSELGQKSWNKLSPEKRTEYGLQAWTEKEWNTANDLARPLRS